MILDTNRRIRDNLHGSIALTDFEDKVIAHPYFQRLRRIRQTAFLSMVFPGATHTRFEHSLGTMHLASQAWQKIVVNQKRLNKNRSSKQNYDFLESTVSSLESVSFSKELLQLLRLAALLHDVGHPPFSHTGELFLPTYKSFLSAKIRVPEYLLNCLIKKKEDGLGSEKITHEIMSVIAIDQILSDIFSLDKDYLFNISSQDIASILMPEISPSPGSLLEKYKLQKLFHELVSGEVDIDRMDYLLRDSKACGVAYGLFDIDRILDSLTYYFSSCDQYFHLSLKFSGLAAFEDYLRARQSMYLQLYFHKTSVSCEAMLKYVFRSLAEFNLPKNIEQYMKIDDDRFVLILKDQISVLSISNKDESHLHKILDNLFFERKLWKCIYESSSFAEESKGKLEIEPHIKELVKNKECYEWVSSSNYLCYSTNESNNKKNFLRLIRKNSDQVYNIVPLCKFSKMYQDNSIIKIDRVYIPVS